jgi:hypothetical protein
MTTQHTLPAHPLEQRIIVQRNKDGAFTVLGRRWSLLANQLRNSAPAHLIAQTRNEILQIKADGGQYVHGNHGAQR